MQKKSKIISHSQVDIQLLQKTAQDIRKDIIDMLVPLESHHIGCSLSIVDIAVYLYLDELNVFPKRPQKLERDIFILSKGHGAAAIYAVLAAKGFFPKKLLNEYDTDGGTLPEHITSAVPGVEFSTGSLGHGLPVGLGFALNFKSKKMNNRVIVLMSDGELNEGSNWEAFMFATHHNLSNVIAIVDNNGMQGYGKTTDVLNIEPIKDKLAAFGWNTYEVDGHNFEDLRKAFRTLTNQKNEKPQVIIAHTIKGKGIPYFEGKFESHYHSLTVEQKSELLLNMKP